MSEIQKGRERVYGDELLFQLITDGAFGYAAEKQLRMQSETSESNYMYLFGYRSNATIGVEGFWNGTEWIGKCRQTKFYHYYNDIICMHGGNVLLFRCATQWRVALCIWLVSYADSSSGSC